MIDTTGPGALARGRAAFAARFGAAGEVAARAPGRVNLIGEHVDYNDGFVLPAAIDRDVVVIARPVAGSAMRVLAADLGEEATFDVARTRADEVPAWARYLAGVAGALREAGVSLTGAELAVAGDVPRGAGLASSAALEVATATALLALTRTTLAPSDVIDLCRRAEHQWVGVQCGLMDQYASVHGRADHALLLDCRAGVHRAVALPGRLRLVAIDAGIDRKLAGSAYNQRVRECAEAAAALGVASLRD
ncbi:MAG: galactokinase, partial [Longimicrobiales bacterium]